MSRIRDAIDYAMRAIHDSTRWDEESADGNGGPSYDDEINAAIAEQEARIAELEKALRPFAEAHRWLEASGMGAMRKQYESSMSCTGKFGAADLKRAAELV